jgi:hypothetical protein
LGDLATADGTADIYRSPANCHPEEGRPKSNSVSVTFRIELIGHEERERPEQARVLSSHVRHYIESVVDGLPRKEERSDKT